MGGAESEQKALLGRRGREDEDWLRSCSSRRAAQMFTYSSCAGRILLGGRVTGSRFRNKTCWLL